MNWSARIRQSHRWVALVFTLVVAAIFLALGLGQTPAAWVYYVPLAPLALLMLSGLYMLVRPWIAGRGDAADGPEGAR